MENNVQFSDISNLKDIGSGNTIINCKFVGGDIVIGNNCTLKNVVVGSETNITDAYIDDCLIGRNCKIGPFTRIRGNSNIGNNCKLGNFVEIKNSQLYDGVKISHLAYVGDAIIGEGTNIGCGVVFANYNGKKKNISVVGKRCFVGSNVTLVAPIKIADDTFICAGTVVTRSTDKGDFVIGRCRDVRKEKYSYYLKNEKQQEKY